MSGLPHQTSSACSSRSGSCSEGPIPFPLLAHLWHPRLWCRVLPAIYRVCHIHPSVSSASLGDLWLLFFVVVYQKGVCSSALFLTRSELFSPKLGTGMWWWGQHTYSCFLFNESMFKSRVVKGLFCWAGHVYEWYNLSYGQLLKAGVLRLQLYHACVTWDQWKVTPWLKKKE